MKSFFKYLYYCALTFCLLFAVYYITTPNAEDTAFYFYYKIFFCASLVTPLPFFINKHLSWKNIICESIIGILWSLVTPLFYYNVYDSAGIPYDIASGCYLFSLLILLKWYLYRYINHSLANILVFILSFITLLIPLLNISYFALYKHPLGINAMIAIMQTNPMEAKEYLLSLPLYYHIGTVMLLITCYLLSKLKLYDQSCYYFYSDYPLKILAIIIVLVPSIIFLSSAMIIKNSQFIDNAYQAYHYFTEITFYRNNRKEILNGIVIKNKNQLPKPHTIIMVIGESASRDYMHAYTPMKDNTTPWLSSKKHDFILFTNAYSCAYSTIFSLQNALTSANFYNKKTFAESISIIDIAKLSGYKTYWFSNQDKIGKFETPVTLIAEQSNIAYWNSTTNVYDGNMVNYLDKINPNDNNFIVFHFMGSHAFYSNRYPEEYQIWTNPSHSGGVEDYKNTILYTDAVLKEIFEYSTQNLNVASFIYCSDHGTDPKTVRDPDDGDYDNLRIPLFIYLSPNYRSANPSIARELEKNKSKPFSNDLLYNLLCSILNIESDYFDECESIASPKYNYNFSNVKTDFGEKFVKDDPYYAK